MFLMKENYDGWPTSNGQSKTRSLRSKTPKSLTAKPMTPSYCPARKDTNNDVFSNEVVSNRVASPDHMTIIAKWRDRAYR